MPSDPIPSILTALEGIIKYIIQPDSNYLHLYQITIFVTTAHYNYNHNSYRCNYCGSSWYSIHFWNLKYLLSI